VARTLRLLTWLSFLMAGLLLMSAGSGADSGSAVAVIPIQGMIDPGMKNFVQRSLAEAREEGVAAVILELDTHGGYIASAEAIRRELDSFPEPVYALVRPRAISAGAYLALSAEAIYMVPGATMGAAEPRAMGMDVDEKTFSWWEKEMRGVAERSGRDPQVAAAMVRKEISIPGLVKQGELLTLTAAEALEVGYSEGSVADRADLLERLGLSAAAVKEYSPGFTDNMVSWTTNPYIATILLVIGIGGMVLEIFTAGFGVAGILSLIAFAFYFGGHIAAGLAEYWVVFLFVFGVVMMVVEAFIPGFGVFGVAGLLATVASIVLAAASVKSGLIMLAIALVLAGAFSTLAFRFFARRGALRHIILSDEERPELGYVAPADRKNLLGLEGTALSPLRPAGAAEIAGQRVDVVSEGGFIAAGAALKVVQVEGVRVVVRPLNRAVREQGGAPAAEQ
jgi:membrane-bound serine protease (ClpP class)